jgi:hypothetical protein
MSSPPIGGAAIVPAGSAEFGRGTLGIVPGQYSSNFIQRFNLFFIKYFL